MKQGFMQQKLKLIMNGFLVTVLVVFVGCSGDTEDIPELGQVSGTVSMDGEALSGAQILFIPTAGSSSVGSTDELGRYELAFNKNVKGAVIGQHTVQIKKYGEPGSANDTENLVPEKYGDQSKLTAEIVAGKNEVDFAL